MLRAWICNADTVFLTWFLLLEMHYKLGGRGVVHSHTCPDQSETPIVADAGVYWRPGAEPEACAQEAGEAGVCGNSGDTPCAIVKGGDEEVDEEEVVTETTEGCC